MKDLRCRQQRHHTVLVVIQKMTCMMAGSGDGTGCLEGWCQKQRVENDPVHVALHRCPGVEDIYIDGAFWYCLLRGLAWVSNALPICSNATYQLAVV